MNRKNFAIGLIIFLMIVILYIAYQQNADGRETILTLFGEKQKILSNQVARNFEKYFNQKITVLKFLARDYETLGPKKSMADNRVLSYADSIQGNQDEIYWLSDTKQLDALAEKLALEDSARFRLRDSFLDVNTRPSAADIEGSRIILLGRGVKNGVLTAILYPVSGIAGEYRGTLLELVDLGNVMEAILTPDLIRFQDRAVVFTKDGRLIYHSVHPHMLFKGLGDFKQICSNCHDSFKLEQDLMAELRDWGEQSDHEKQNIVSRSTISIPGFELVLVVTMPDDSMRMVIRKQFLSFLLLGIALVMVTLIGMILINRYDKIQQQAVQELDFFKTKTELMDSIQEAEEKYRALVNQSPNLILILREGKIVFANDRFREIFGESISELRELDAHLTVESGQDLHQQIAKVGRGDQKLTQLLLSETDGGTTIRIFQSTITAIHFGGKMACQLVMWDVTEQKKLEATERRKNHLAFIGEMSTRIAHEIKNPLASINSGIQLLESMVKMDEETSDYLHRLTSEVMRVDGIVKGMLSFAREEVLNKRSFDVMSLVKRVRDLISTAGEYSGMTWQIKSDGQKRYTIFADEEKMEQVIWNILINAVHASDGRGKVHIEMKRMNGSVQINVQDNGKGISPENVVKIFQPFFSTKSQGTGLGMAISKKIIEAHGGDIEINSRLGEGTTVIINIPGGTGE